MRRPAPPAAAAAAALVALACTLPPLRGEMEVGKEPYLVFVGEGSGGADLFAVRPGGGVAIALTFSPVEEQSPALAPDGGTLAFVRRAAGTRPGAWAMNLLSGAEREIELPSGAGEPRRIGWARDGSAIIIETERGIWRAPMPPGSGDPLPVTGAAIAAADSALGVFVGEPAFAEVVACDSVPDALCTRSAGGEGVLSEGSGAAARWGRDSVAYVRGGVVEVRPLGPGRARRIEITPAREVTGGITYFGLRLE